MGALREGLVDLEIGVLGKSGPEVRVQTLFRDHFVCAVREGHPLLGKGKITAERYAACGHVVASRRGHESGPVDEALAALGLTRTVVAVVPSFRAALSVASVSDLVALVTDSFFNATQGHQAKSGPAESGASHCRFAPRRSRSHKCGTRASTPIRRIAGCEAWCWQPAVKPGR